MSEYKKKKECQIWWFLILNIIDTKYEIDITSFQLGLLRFKRVYKSYTNEFLYIENCIYQWLLKKKKLIEI